MHVRLFIPLEKIIHITLDTFREIFHVLTLNTELRMFALT